MRGRPAELKATRSVRARLLPLLVLLVFVVSLSAPLAMYLTRLNRLRSHTRGVGARVAALIAAEARHHPRLWRYNTAKLVDHVQQFEHEIAVHRIVVTDDAGRPLSELDPARLRQLRATPLIWSRADVTVDGRRVGRVWVSTSARQVRQRFFKSLVGFGLIALLLGVLLYRIPLRTLSRAEAELAALTESLEERVEERSSALADAIAELRDKEQRLRELSARTLAMNEAERRAIGRELHDSVGQALTAVRINLQLLGERAADADYVQQQSAQTLALADAILEEVRRAVRRLGPSIVAERGLAAAAQTLCDDFAERTGVTVRCDVDLEGAELATATENECYRVLQEGLTNVARHAEASVVTVSLRRRGGGLRLELADDGQGFDTEDRPAREGGHGLTSMRERAELLGGRFAIESAAGEGTRLTVDLPGQSGDKERGDAPPREPEHDPD